MSNRRVYRSTEYPVHLDGGHKNPLPVIVRGYWEESSFIVEEVELRIGQAKYDIIENLTQGVIEHLRAQVEEFELEGI